MLEGLVGKTATGEVLRVREVWQDNLEEEMAIIESIVEDYPFLAMDTEFPGAVCRSLPKCMPQLCTPLRSGPVPGTSPLPMHNPPLQPGRPRARYVHAAVRPDVPAVASPGNGRSRNRSACPGGPVRRLE